METKLLERLWTELCRKYTEDDELVASLWNELKAAYTHPSRHYHSLKHVQAMTDLALQYKSELKDLDVLLFSIFYHDIVYQSSNKDNELRSAQLAKSRLRELGLDITKTEKVYQQILATKNHEAQGDPDCNFLLDFDLSVLAGTREEYEEYCAKVRKEYQIYPNFIYRKGRKKVLRHFLEQEAIFKTEVFYNLYEQDARFNLKQELSALS